MTRVSRKTSRGEIRACHTIQSGKEREELGELEGRAYKPVMPDETEEGTTERLKVEWVVNAKKGTKIRLMAKHSRAGVVRAEVILK